MAVASDQQIAIWAAQAGWPVEQIPHLVAVSHGESGGDPARNQIGGGGRGLLQVDIWQHPQFAGLNLNDPLVNLQTALGIWKAQGWGAWYGKLSNMPTLDQVKAWISGVGSNLPSAPSLPNPMDVLGGGISGAGTAIGAAIGGIPGQIGHGVANFLGSSASNLITFAKVQEVALFVAIIVVLVVFLH